MHALKSIFSLIGFLLLATLLQAQVLWEKTWGGPYDDGCEVRNTRDGGMVVMASSGVRSWLMRLDANGDTLWTRIIHAPYDLCAVTETMDGGFLATGLTRYAHRDIMAWKFDVHGDSLWVQIYTDSTNTTEGMYSVFPQPDSSFLVTGYTSGNGYDMLALHIEKSGNLIWRKSYGGPDFQGGTMASPTADGGFVFATTTGNSFSSIWVVRVDAMGDTVWTRNVVNARETGGPIPLVAQDGNIWVVGWINRTDYDNYIFCMDSLGNLLWTRPYPGIGFESRSGRGLIEDRLGGFSFASSIDDAYGPVAGQDIALFRLDSIGQVTRIHRLGGVGDEMPRYFEQTANGDYLFVGYSTSFSTNGAQTYLARLHPTGCGEFLYDLSEQIRYDICPGDTLWLDAGAQFTQFLWNDGNTQQIRPVLQSDTLYVVATDSQGCLNYSSLVAVEAHPAPDFVWSPLSGMAFQFSGSVAPGSTVTWDFGDGMGDSLLAPQHTYALPGTYEVCMTATFPNCNPVTICDSVTAVIPIGLAPQWGSRVQVFPNPSAGWVTLRNDLPEALSYVVRDVAGRSWMVGQMEGNARIRLDLRTCPDGAYFIETTANGQRGPRLSLMIAR